MKKLLLILLLLKSVFSFCQDFNYPTILKSKLNKSDSEIDKFNFTFYHKINISKILGLFENDKELDEFIINLNKLRNQIAHKMNYDNFLYDKIVEYPALYDETKWETKEKFRIGMMMLKSNYMCGKIQGKIDKYEVELKNKKCRIVTGKQIGRAHV